MTSYRYFNPERALAPLRGDKQGFRLLAQAYAQELPLHIAQLQQHKRPTLRQLLHQLSATFGIFQCQIGQDLVQTLRQRLSASDDFPFEECQQLEKTMNYLNEELTEYLETGETDV